jgi:hypothetical protein
MTERQFKLAAVLLLIPIVIVSIFVWEMMAERRGWVCNPATPSNAQEPHDGTGASPSSSTTPDVMEAVKALEVMVRENERTSAEIFKKIIDRLEDFQGELAQSRSQADPLFTEPDAQASLPVIKKWLCTEQAVYVAAGEPTQVVFSHSLSGGYKSRADAIEVSRENNVLVLLANDTLSGSGTSMVVFLKDGTFVPLRILRASDSSKRHVTLDLSRLQVSECPSAAHVAPSVEELAPTPSRALTPSP